MQGINTLATEHANVTWSIRETELEHKNQTHCESVQYSVQIGKGTIRPAGMRTTRS